MATSLQERWEKAFGKINPVFDAKNSTVEQWKERILEILEYFNYVTELNSISIPTMPLIRLLGLPNSNWVRYLKGDKVTDGLIKLQHVYLVLCQTEFYLRKMIELDPNPARWENLMKLYFSGQYANQDINDDDITEQDKVTFVLNVTKDTLNGTGTK